MNRIHGQGNSAPESLEVGHHKRPELPNGSTGFPTGWGPLVTSRVMRALSWVISLLNQVLKPNIRQVPSWEASRSMVRSMGPYPSNLGI